MHISAAALTFFHSGSKRFFTRCRICSTGHLSSRRGGAEEWKVLIKAADLTIWCPPSQIVATFTNTARKEMVKKTKKSVSQWDSGMPMVLLKPRESGVFFSCSFPHVFKLFSCQHYSCFSCRSCFCERVAPRSCRIFMLCLL